PEDFGRCDPGEARLRIRLQAKILAEGSIAVDARAKGQEVAVFRVQHSLAEESRVHHPLPVLESEPRAAAGHGRIAWTRKVLSVCRGFTLVCCDALSSPR